MWKSYTNEVDQRNYKEEESMKLVWFETTFALFEFNYSSLGAVGLLYIFL